MLKFQIPPKATGGCKPKRFGGYKKLLVVANPKVLEDIKLTKIDNDCPGLYKFQAKHNDDQTEARICRNHDNVSLVAAANKY